MTEAEERLIRHRSRLRAGQHRVAARRVPAAGLPALRRVQRRIAGRPGLYPAAVRAVRLRSSRWPRCGATARVTYHRPIPPLLAALLESYREWGGTASPPTIAIVDLRDVPTWTEFELLRDAFVEAGVPTVVCDPRDLTFDGGVLRADGRAHRSRLPARAASTTSWRGRTTAPALVAAYEQRAVCVANTFRCKLPHKKAFFAVLTDPAYAVADVRRASGRSCARTCRGRGWSPTSGPTAAARRRRCSSVARRDRDQLVLKPNDEYGGTGVMLGWEASAGEWDAGLQRALADPPGTWVVQERIPVRREVFPHFDDAGPRDDARHARRPRAVPVPRQAGRLPHPPQHDRARQRHVGRRAGAGLRGW